MFFVIDSVLDRYKTQEMCDSVVSEDYVMLIHLPNRYKTERMWNKAVNDCLAALKFVPDWFVTRKMRKKIHDALNANDDI